ncbi:MAG TPA: DUF2339 domain-containing protein, partial [Chitinophagaceae bacterium]|nr:DUF2339 domain-containing protein [Chitinophagaceae bacterium]
MSEGENIEQLRKEIERLSNDLASYQQQVNTLRNAIMKLTHAGSINPAVSAQKPAPAKRPDLENFIGLRLIHLVGMVVLVIGISIGVKYAIDSNLMSERARISLAYGAGITLFFISVQLRQKYPGFSAILFSGAMASIYFTTYAAFTYYSIFSFPVAFILMIVLTILTVYKAISYNRQEIALLGLVGAYGIPFLVSKNADRADLFFLYISLINSAVIFLCIKKHWKLVGRVAQAITWILFIGWASIRFTSNMQWTAVLFMSFFFFLFHAN